MVNGVENSWKYVYVIKEYTNTIYVGATPTSQLVVLETLLKLAKVAIQLYLFLRYKLY